MLETARLRYPHNEEEARKEFEEQLPLWPEVQIQALVILRGAAIILVFMLVLIVALQLTGTEQWLIDNVLPHTPEPHVIP